MRLFGNQTASIVHVLLLACVGTIGCDHGAATGEPSNMMCVKRLMLPKYPPLAQASHVSIVLPAVITLATDGAVQSVVFDNASDARLANQHLFRPTVDESIRLSVFDPSCAQKTVRISYVFRMDVDPAHDITASWFAYPNRIEIWAVSPRF